MSSTEIFGGRGRRNGAGTQGGVRALTTRARLWRGVRSLWAVVAACVALAALSLLVPSAPTYDPWAWIVWGREITELDLDTEHGPSWKPLPVLFTTLFAPLGDVAPALWLVVARAGGFLALVMAYRLASRLAGRGIPGILAGAVAFLGLLVSTGWVRTAGLGNSEPLLVALVLWAVERHLVGARTQAFALCFGAALLRPEVWPFLGGYAVYLWLAEPRARRLVIALVALLPVLWFGPELWGSGDPLRASTRARDPNPGSPAFADRPALEILRLTGELLIAPVEAGALIGLAAASLLFWRRRADRAVLALCLGAAAWIALVATMTEAGYAGNPRYLILAGALACVVAGVGWARLVDAAGLVARRLAGSARLAVGVDLAAAVALLAAATPYALQPLRELPEQVEALRTEGILYRDLETAVRLTGGRERLFACGDPFTGPYHVTGLAWRLDVHVGEVGFEPEAPAVVFRERDEKRPVIPKGPGFRLFAEVGEWDVAAACRPGAELAGA